MFYRWRFERALRALGYDPGALPRLNRRAGIADAQVNGHTQQEAAVILVARLPAQRRRRLSPETIRNWVLRGKLDLKKDHIRDALEAGGPRNFRA